MQFLIDHCLAIVSVSVIGAIIICSVLLKVKNDRHRANEGDIEYFLKKFKNPEGCEDAKDHYLSIQTLVLDEGTRLPASCSTLKAVHAKACESLELSILTLEMRLRSGASTAVIKPDDLKAQCRSRSAILQRRLQALYALKPATE